MTSSLRVKLPFETVLLNNCGGVFEQLARYTMRYGESDLHLGVYSSLTSADKLNLPTPFYFSLPYSNLLVQV